MMPSKPSPCSAVLPEFFKDRGGPFLHELLRALDEAWLRAAAHWPPATRYSKNELQALAELAETFGWGGLLSAAGGAANAARPEMLAWIPSLHGGAEQLISFWTRCLFDFELLSMTTERQALSIQEIGPPVVRMQLRCKNANVSTETLRAVLQRLIPAQCMLVEVSFGAPALADTAGA